MKFNLINRLLLQRNDELDCDYIRAMNLPKEQADLRNKIIHDTAEKGGELSVPGSPVAGFSGTTRILRMGFQLSTF